MIQGFQITLNNVVKLGDDSPETIIELVQDILEKHDVPAQVITVQEITDCVRVKSYYVNQHSYLTGLWGMLRVNAGTNRQRIAVRDYLEAAASACKLKYEGSSRALSGKQLMQNEIKMMGSET